MIGQLRIYTIKEGMMESWLKLFDQEIAPHVIDTGMGIETVWVDREHSKFIWIRTYANKEDIEIKETGFYGSEWWIQNVDRVRGHLVNRDITVIEPISVS
jgi:hypothetical protein